ncbi:nucleotidyl transferase AbiEii/AbiGii toxin family protein [Candidatus Pollutiaquabacter sp.]|uniref:nucleotidyl transferase AbiEii/AbiGii toxin family protein n=1 Tax=Candidatus Pollutiaquabacter sp. TaxID=3416354 RepID=UPI003C8807BD|nr:nucleotidyl transferase AbiEii/AbiGii toxin family protein [Bacteroidota bacterium]
MKVLQGIVALKHFYLAGETALALHYGHRISADLDCFTPRVFESSEILDELNQYHAIGVWALSRNSLTLSLDVVKVDFIRHDYPLIKPAAVVDVVRIASPEDIGAMKLNSIANRGAKKDFFDLHELLRYFSLSALLGFYKEKYSQSEWAIALKSLTYFDDADLEPDPVSIRKISWKQVKEDVSNCVRSFGL